MRDESQHVPEKKPTTKSGLNDISLIEKLLDEAKMARPVEVTKALIIQNLTVALSHHLMCLKQRAKNE